MKNIMCWHYILSLHTLHVMLNTKQTADVSTCRSFYLWSRLLEHHLFMFFPLHFALNDTWTNKLFLCIAETLSFLRFRCFEKKYSIWRFKLFVLWVDNIVWEIFLRPTTLVGYKEIVKLMQTETTRLSYIWGTQQVLLSTFCLTVGRTRLFSFVFHSKEFHSVRGIRDTNV